MTTDLTKRNRRADNVARAVALLVAAAGLALVVWPVLANERSRDALFGDPSWEETVTKRVEKTEVDGRKTVEETTSDDPGSLLERSLAAGGLLLMRLGVVAGAAFLAGAVVQRTMLGHFALELGPLKVPDLPEAAAASEEGIAALKTRVVQQDGTIRTIGTATSQAVQGVSEEIARLKARTEELERAAAELAAQPKARPAPRRQSGAAPVERGKGQ